jgi:hypothetical protein
MSASGDSEHLSHVESDMMEDPDFEGENLHDILETFFLESKKNRNVVDILLEIKRSLEMHNKIMVKMLTHLQASTKLSSS